MKIELRSPLQDDLPANVVTLEQIKGLILSENLRPEDVFDEKYLKSWREGQDYADGVMAKIRAEENRAGPGEKTAESKPETEPEKKDQGSSKYLDPAQNKFIKIGED